MVFYDIPPEEIIERYEEVLLNRNIPPGLGPLLTKSKFLNGLQCPKLLWTRCNASATIPEPSDMLRQIFAVGHQVGHLATLRFPGGSHVPEDDFLKNIAQTQELLRARIKRPLYEAGIRAGRLYARADVLVPSRSQFGAWDIIEVKCSTKCKDVYLWDIAFQKYCYEQVGLSIGQSYLLHVNNKYVRDGTIDPKGLFTSLNVNMEIQPFYTQVPDLVKRFLNIIDMPKCPTIVIRQHCSKPYECLMKPLCWDFLPNGSVMELHRGKKKGFDLLDQKIERLEDIPANIILSDYQQIQYACALSGKEHVDSDAIAGFIRTLEYPLYFMDFETIFEPIPRFDGNWPYQQVPFQFSVHVQEEPGAALRHIEYLHMGQDDPRPFFASRLRAALGDKGDIIVFNKSFEEARIKELAEAFLDYADWSEDVLRRIVDLIVPFRKGYYYNSKQAGSNSIKKVLPALTDKSYTGVNISDGGKASLEYARVTYDDNVTDNDRAKIYQDLKEYCCLDTKAMIDILNSLRRYL